MLMIVCVGFTSCSKDDNVGGSNLLIGSWGAVADYNQINGNWVLDKTYSAGECIWTFDETYVLVNNKSDLLNGQKVPYSYDSNKKILTFTYMGMGWNVYKLTQTDFEVEGLTILGNSHITTKTVFKRIQ